MHESQKFRVDICIAFVLSRGGGRGGRLLTPVANARTQEAATKSLGKHVVPKPPSVLVLETLGRKELRSVEADDDDYEEYKEKHGDYPEWLYKFETEVGFVFFCFWVCLPSIVSNCSTRARSTPRTQSPRPTPASTAWRSCCPLS